MESPLLFVCVSSPHNEQVEDGEISKKNVVRLIFVLFPIPHVLYVDIHQKFGWNSTR